MDLILFLAVLSLLVFVHEAGHFLVAKKAGIKVLEFGFGLPPRLLGKKIGETIYSLNLLPIGGFVKLFGEDSAEIAEASHQKKLDEVASGAREGELAKGQSDAEGTKELKRAFFNQSKKVRLAVLSAGVVMNVILGILLFSSLYTVMGIPTPVDKVQVVALTPDSPAAEAFELGDVVKTVNGKQVFQTDEFKSRVEELGGEEVSFVVEREDEELQVTATPRVNYPEGQGALGVVIAPKIEFVHYPVWQMPVRGVWFGVEEAVSWGVNIASGLRQMLGSVLSGKAPSDIGGPFEIYFLVSEVADVGLMPLVQLVGVLSVNLAIINLLPIPALDGGRLVFILVEAIIGKRVNPRLEQLSHAVGMAFLLALLFAITVQDVMRRI